ncbi:hypothetical protein EGT07_18415 [Herbaspirillum sp. HC18]|nr:hypothetical protein EGT07_18415 [Herbaspirillum sp. HC18]
MLELPDSLPAVTGIVILERRGGTGSRPLARAKKLKINERGVNQERSISHLLIGDIAIPVFAAELWFLVE